MHTNEVVHLLGTAAETTLTWLEETGLQVAIEKSEFILFTNRRVRNSITILLREVRINSKKSIKYFGVHMDPKLNYIIHAKIATNKATTSTIKLGRIMPNIRALKSRRRKLLSTVITSQILYGCQAWADKMGPVGQFFIA